MLRPVLPKLDLEQAAFKVGISRLWGKVGKPLLELEFFGITVKYK